jgi:hypothetical protein
MAALENGRSNEIGRSHRKSEVVSQVPVQCWALVKETTTKT